ncbi:MAG: hypothetical protein A3C35_01180 [Omnitrophica bacterium RIFCSPHIGHO2_02_FULL_46_11]|nr:MAG: hypothetical protein A3A81_01950 [Omnitrophica bacterium RIFCSPLOWO2_01_FULL_45_10b]OGW87131.1 MAG: hypothetical protein A3C35_01180 [Omnitrophica bacterium RIFCSPHIGHO2_02_FULL_46_11]
MISFDESSREFIARNVADMGKAVLTVGFASYFFEKLPIYYRISFPLMGVLLVIVAIFIHAMRKGGKQ